MSVTHSFSCPLPNGIHARPASALEEVARHFKADICLVNRRTGREASAKSVLSIVGADIRFNDPCVLNISGPDENAAIEALESFVRNALPHQDDTLPQTQMPPTELHLPPLLRHARAAFIRGIPAVPGIAEGLVVRAGGFQIPAGLPLTGVHDIPREQQRIREGLHDLIEWYERRAKAAGGIQADLLLAHRSIARDEALLQRLEEAIAFRHRTAAGAVAEAEAHFTEILRSSENPLLRERALDIRDVCDQLLQRIYGVPAHAQVVLNTPALVLADALTPSQFLAFDPTLLKGLLLTEAGTTSHTVILARSRAIPTLVGIDPSAAVAGQHAILDADAGVLVTQLSPEAHRYYALERDRLDGRARVLAAVATEPAKTRDGHRLEIAANIAAAEDAVRAFAAGAEGIGLFRTEMLFLDRTEAPSEAFQYEAYRSVLEAANGKPVIVRTVDIGGDKPLPYLNLPIEANPFLGFRAIRMYPELSDIIRVQLRALLRASAHGPLSVLLPMVSTVDEVRWFKQVLGEERDRCTSDGHAFDPSLRLGAMIEVPSAALAIDDLSRELDFFSIGSNDLLQYVMAAERGNPRVAGLYNPLQPSFLRLLRSIVDTARARGKWIGLCGELGGQPQFLPLLAGLGLSEISAAVPAIGTLKAELANLNLSDCRDLFQSAIACATASEVAALLEGFTGRRDLPLISSELIAVEVDARTKGEAIKRAVDLLYIHGRTDTPRDLEDAVWQREATYTTGFGHGFAIPHCKTGAVRANALVLIKTRSPVDWGSLDQQPVRVILLLAIREADGAVEHMKIISRLARLVMHEEFRAALDAGSEPAALCAFLKAKLAC